MEIKMPSKIYNAKDYFKLQNEGKVGRNIPISKKLRLDSRGYYLNKRNSKGMIYRVDVKSTDKVYARSSNDGTTLYSKERDRDKTNVEHKKEGTKKHNSRPQFSDREAESGRTYSI